MVDSLPEWKEKEATAIGSRAGKWSRWDEFGRANTKNEKRLVIQKITMINHKLREEMKDLELKKGKHKCKKC